VAEVLFGDVNPSDACRSRYERRWEDNPVHDSYYPEANTKRVVYKEGVSLVIVAMNTRARSRSFRSDSVSPTQFSSSQLVH